MSGPIIFAVACILLLIIVLALIWWHEHRRPLPPLWIDGEPEQGEDGGGR